MSALKRRSRSASPPLPSPNKARSEASRVRIVYYCPLPGCQFTGRSDVLQRHVVDKHRGHRLETDGRGSALHYLLDGRGVTLGRRTPDTTTPADRSDESTPSTSDDETDLMALARGTGPERGRRRSLHMDGAVEEARTPDLPPDLMQLMHQIYSHPSMRAALAAGTADPAGSPGQFGGEYLRGQVRGRNKDGWVGRANGWRSKYGSSAGSSLEDGSTCRTDDHCRGQVNRIGGVAR